MPRMYKSVESAQNGAPIPVFQSGRPAHSRYAPEREAQRFALAAGGGDVFFIAGMCGGYQISALSRRFPKAKILVAEQSHDDVKFLEENIPEVRALLKNPQIAIFPYDEAESILKEQYVPAVRPTFRYLETRSWTSEMPDAAEKVREAVRGAISEISADFSVQAHFGRLWQRNIIKNLKAANFAMEISCPTEKTAVVAAAGPSLDEAARWISERRGEFFVIATDTAYKVLQRRNIRCDAVVSIDGQPISRAHFMSKMDSSALFVFDVCGNPQALRKAVQGGRKAVLASTGHPLSQYAEQCAEREARLLPLRPGAGTVTIAAADFALLAGFSKIILAGADFSYTRGRAYARGTYLDDVYGMAQTRLNQVETSFCSLLFRTELIDCAEAGLGTSERNAPRKTTPVLDSYRRSLEKWISERGLESRTECGLRLIFSKAKTAGAGGGLKVRWNSADFNAFAKALSSDAEKIRSQRTEHSLSPAETAALPYAAWFRNKERPDEFGRRLPFQKIAEDALDDAVLHSSQIPPESK